MPGGEGGVNREGFSSAFGVLAATLGSAVGLSIGMGTMMTYGSYFRDDQIHTAHGIPRHVR